MKEDNVLQVYYEEKRVGILALTADHKAAFQYDEKWLENGFSISPFSLPLKKQVFLPTKDIFEYGTVFSSKFAVIIFDGE